VPIIYLQLQDVQSPRGEGGGLQLDNFGWSKGVEERNKGVEEGSHRGKFGRQGNGTGRHEAMPIVQRQLQGVQSLIHRDLHNALLL